MQNNTINTEIVKTMTHSNTVCCANCGGYGHIHKNCNHPITSYGIICFRVLNNQIQYLMIQRKDSLSYIEFLRGKYALNQKQYIMRLFENMTNEERYALLHVDFTTLWKELWQADRNKNFQKEYQEAKYKFEVLKAGYIIKSTDSVLFFDIKYIINNTTSTLYEPEWGFPKGRRNINEDDFSCALREFKEETNLSLKNVYMIKQQPYEEVFTGTNNVRYRHVYYIAYYCNNRHYVYVNPCNKYQCREIQDIKWFSYDEAQGKIRNYNIERKELFKRVNNNILKMILSKVIRLNYRDIQLQQNEQGEGTVNNVRLLQNCSTR